MSAEQTYRELQAQIDLLIDQLSPESSRYVSNRRRRDEIRAHATHLIQQRDALRRR